MCIFFCRLDEIIWHQFLLFNKIMQSRSTEKMEDEQKGEEEKVYGKYEYLDHTADVQIHAWGEDRKEAFENCAVGMFGYITDLGTVEEKTEEEIEVEADNMQTLLFKFLDEFLFLFCADPFFIARRIEITECDFENFRIKARGFGETFDLDKHPQGTEVKAITFSNMQIHDKEVFVIIDI